MPRTEGLVFHIQRFSLQDGPGLRTTVFFKGCPLACAWCHNPESQSISPELLTVESRCIHCGTCKIVCPSGGAFVSNSNLERVCEVDPDCTMDRGSDFDQNGDRNVNRNVDRDCNLDRPCILCKACVDACPTGARQMIGRSVGVADLVQELLRDRVFFDQSGGGVSFSGGEPLMQVEFVCEVATALKAHSVHTVLDTCGFSSTEDLLRVAACTDLVLYDLKLMDDDRHSAATGESNALILANLKALSEHQHAIWIRVPIIPGLNDDDENLQATAQLAARTPGVQRVNLLPYHASGAAKFGRLGKEYGLKGLQAPSSEQMDVLAQPFRSQGIKVTIGGHS